MKDRAPVVYLGDDSPPVRAAIVDKLTAEGIYVYTPEAKVDPTRATSTMGSFRCGLLHLDRRNGEVDAIEMAALLRFYQSNLPVAFLHETAPGELLGRAHPLGPLFHIPEDLGLALAWARAYTK